VLPSDPPGDGASKWIQYDAENPIGIRLILLGLVVLPVAVLVLPFNVDRHFSDSHASKPRSAITADLHCFIR